MIDQQETIQRVLDHLAKVQQDREEDWKHLEEAVRLLGEMLKEFMQVDSDA